MPAGVVGCFGVTILTRCTCLRRTPLCIVADRGIVNSALSFPCAALRRARPSLFSASEIDPERPAPSEKRPPAIVTSLVRMTWLPRRIDCLTAIVIDPTQRLTPMQRRRIAAWPCLTANLALTSAIVLGAGGVG